MEIKMPSGNTLVVTRADFTFAEPLATAILNEARGGAEAEALTPAVRAAIKPCLTRALWGGRQVNDQLFDDPKDGDDARADWYEICKAVIKVNTEPFFRAVFSGSSAPGPGSVAAPK